MPGSHSKKDKLKKRIAKAKQRLALIGTMPALPKLDKYKRVISNEPQTFQQQSTRARTDRNMRVWATADDFKVGPSGKKELNWDKMIEEKAKPDIQQYSNIPEEKVVNTKGSLKRSRPNIGNFQIHKITFF